MPNIRYEEAVKVMMKKLEGRGIEQSRACAVAETIAGISRDGVYSHGINRFKRMILSIDNGTCKPNETPECVAKLGSFERWDGKAGMGIVNALTCTDRAIELAKEHGIACVSLGNTNHWFRAGTYGWRMAEAGMYGIVFTNSDATIVYHGTLDRVLGTTPLVLAVPRNEGPIVADVSLGEYSYGKLQLAKLAGKQMPKPAGYDSENQLSTDPTSVMKEARLLPLGEYKGSAINLLLDLMTSATGLGRAACEISETPGDEIVSQMFIAINSRAVNSTEEEEAIINRQLDYLLKARPAPGFSSPRYPGQNIMKTRAENTQNGIPVDDKIWQDILEIPDRPN